MADIVTPNEYQATVLHLFGLDHTKLMYHSNGREQRLNNGQSARVFEPVLA